jgi:hypothetical protein
MKERCGCGIEEIERRETLGFPAFHDVPVGESGLRIAFGTAAAFIFPNAKRTPDETMEPLGEAASIDRPATGSRIPPGWLNGGERPLGTQVVVFLTQRLALAVSPRTA